MGNKRDLIELKQDLKIVESNRLNIYQSKLYFMGLFFEVILNKELFPRNKDLKEFINEHIAIHFITKKRYKDYLFKSRTLLAASIIREIYINVEYDQILEMVKELDLILPENLNSQNKKNKNKNSKNDDLSDWLGYYSSDEEK
ncbi:hypothetical protein [Metaclostridioides mangenotii]|uniref:hypothetical protein n=1 Tax=Metaclostridioides mangenotii TaxID=1540 RepID=UPI0026F2D11C|nr:hypothetical protein [Clostridioides mangenotii]